MIYDLYIRAPIALVIRSNTRKPLRIYTSVMSTMVCLRIHQANPRGRRLSLTTHIVIWHPHHLITCCERILQLDHALCWWFVSNIWYHGRYGLSLELVFTAYWHSAPALRQRVGEGVRVAGLPFLNVFYAQALLRNVATHAVEEFFSRLGGLQFFLKGMQLCVMFYLISLLNFLSLNVFLEHEMWVCFIWVPGFQEPVTPPLLWVQWHRIKLRRRVLSNMDGIIAIFFHVLFSSWPWLHFFYFQIHSQLLIARPVPNRL